MAYTFGLVAVLIFMAVCFWIDKQCRHKWTKVKEINLVDDTNTRIGIRYHFKCDNCGEYKKKDMH